MPTRSAAGRLFPGLLLLLAGAVGADVGRRAIEHVGSRPAIGHALPPVETAAVMSGSTPERGGVARNRIREENIRTYLAESLSETDSMLRRWPDTRFVRPLRVVILRQHVAGFREEFVSNVLWAMYRWSGVVPVLLETGTDSATADIVVAWTDAMDGNRTGRTDLTWDRRGNIHQALIVLATHTPEGQLLDGRRMSALALHEFGHAMGLGHSPSREDALFPVTHATDLSDRDRRTARLLYELPSGSIR